MRSYRKMIGDRRGATSIEYGLIAMLVALALIVGLPPLTVTLRSKMLTAEMGLQGRKCTSDPLAQGVQCFR